MLRTPYLGQWIKWHSTQGNAVPQLQFMAEGVPSSQISLKTHANTRGTRVDV